MDTRARGDEAEAAVMASLVAAGFIVSIPFGRFGPYDLIAERDDRFARVQVKSGRMRGGCIEFNCVGTDHGRGGGRYAGRADIFVVHLHATGEQFVVPVSEALASKMYLRVAATNNGQHAGVRWARDYRLADWLAGGPLMTTGRGR